MKNKEAELKDLPHEVSGMLLYAKTDEEIHPNGAYLMSGNRISVKTLDLNCEFERIADQLDEIVNSAFSEDGARTLMMINAQNDRRDEGSRFMD